MSKIVIIKMVNGEELIATESPLPEAAWKGDRIRFEKIRVFRVTQQGAGLIPWIMCAPDERVEIKDGIAAILDAPAEIEKQYLQVTSSIQLLG